MAVFAVLAVELPLLEPVPFAAPVVDPDPATLVTAAVVFAPWAATFPVLADAVLFVLVLAFCVFAAVVFPAGEEPLLAAPAAEVLLDDADVFVEPLMPVAEPFPLVAAAVPLLLAAVLVDWLLLEAEEPPWVAEPVVVLDAPVLATDVFAVFPVAETAPLLPDALELVFDVAAD
jgi:hypothetical protein